MLVHNKSPDLGIEAWWFVVCENRLLTLVEPDSLPCGTFDRMPFADLNITRYVHIGEYQGKPCYAIDLSDQQFTRPEIEFRSLRRLLGQFDSELFLLVGKAWQVTHFLETHRYCGRCGSETKVSDWELSVKCPACGHQCYPRVSPCVIVAIRRDDRLLLARSSRHPEGLFSVLAGFVESGETLEQAVEREVFEEVGIGVTNIHYFDSQPWPFPHSLMVGFLADYDAGEIRCDDEEILEADWFDVNELPFTPPKVSIAGRLIEHVVQHIKNNRD